MVLSLTIKYLSLSYMSTSSYTITVKHNLWIDTFIFKLTYIIYSFIEIASAVILNYIGLNGMIEGFVYNVPDILNVVINNNILLRPYGD